MRKAPRKRKQFFLAGILLTSASGFIPASFAASSRLLPTQLQHLKQVMDARINNPEDRKTILHEWSDTHRVAEFLWWANFTFFGLAA